MFAKQSHSYTPAEYLALEEKAEYKSEYFQGKIVAMAGASLNHSRIVRNLSALLNQAFAAKPCEVFTTDVRLWIEKRNFFTYPDVIVVCDEPQFFKDRTDTITNPQIIIEVLSKSTAEYDRSDKFHAYWTLDSFAEYVLVDQYRVQVEYFRRVSGKQWELQVFTRLDESLSLKSIEVKLPLEQIYQRVNWEEIPQDSAAGL